MVDADAMTSHPNQPTTEIPRAGWQYSLPILGDMVSSIQMLRDPDFRLHLFEQYGDVVFVRLLGKPVIMVRGADNMQKIFEKTAPISSRGALLRSTGFVAGEEHLVVQDGDIHTRLRDLIGPRFTKRAVLNLVPVVRDLVIKNLEQEKLGNTFNFDRTSTHVTFGMISQFFGLPDDLVETMHTGWRAINRGLYSLAFKLPGTETTFSRALSSRKHVLGLVHELCEAGNIPEDSLIGTLWRARQEEHITSQQFDDNLVLVGLAGHSTTSDTMNCLVYEYLSNVAFRQDLDRVLTQGDEEDVLDAAVRGEIRELEAGIQESMRVHTVVPIVHRRTTAPLQLGAYQLEPETTLLVCIRETHLDESLYENATTFDHTRWKERSVPKFGYFPFGMGPHFCAGSHLAQLELRVFMTILVRQFPLELVDPELVSDIVRGEGRVLVRRC